MYRATVTPEWETEIKGRNPSLQGQLFDVYQFIRDNPYCTRADVTKGCGLRGTSATARVKELIDMGFVHSSTNKTKLNIKTGKRVQTLQAIEENMHRMPKDKVLVKVTLQVDESGRYHAEAHVLGELPKSGRVHNVLTREFTILAPYPSEYKHNFLGESHEAVAKVPVSDTIRNVNLIVDSA